MPEVERLPRLSMVKVGVLAFWIERAVLVEPLVLLMTNELAEPWLVRTNEVGVARPEAKVKEMLLPDVVVIELPPLYADCKEIAVLKHCTTSLEPLIHRFDPDAVVRPFKVRKLEPVVLIVTLLPAVGVKTEFPLAWKLLFAVRVAETVAELRTARLLLSVVKPLEAPIAIVVAAPPMLRVETPELRRLKVLVVEVRLLPLTARSEESVTAPVKAEVPWIVRLPKAWISPELSRVVPLEPYPPLIVIELKLAAALGALMVVALGRERVRLLIVAVPEFLPILTVEAAPPMSRVETVELRRLKVLAVEVGFHH